MWDDVNSTPFCFLSWRSPAGNHGECLRAGRRVHLRGALPCAGSESHRLIRGSVALSRAPLPDRSRGGALGVVALRDIC
ncbi:hypothetical protein MTBSS4_200026 [Magnetospirillum sp. SS-4]|nr:hypothetical protein MTBSS4_200026 [Magnetospirillum sp. SS-4]